MKICGYVPIMEPFILGSGKTYPQFLKKNLMNIGWDFWFQRRRLQVALCRNVTAAAEFAIICGFPRACQ
jgi:hypothetical protein